MITVDPEGKSEKTLKTEELEVLVRLLISNLESLRYLRRESSNEDDVALNNRLLTARISALSGLITFLSEGEIAQIRESNILMHDVTKIRLDSDHPDFPKQNIGTPIDEDGDHDDDDEEEEEEDTDDEIAETEHGVNPTHPSQLHHHPRPNLFQTIRPLMQVLRTGIQDAASANTSDGYGRPSAPVRTPTPNHKSTDGSFSSSFTVLPSTKPRSEYETRDISSIDQKRRPVLGIPAPILKVPWGAIRGGELEPVRGNLNEIKLNRRTSFLSPFQAWVFRTESGTGSDSGTHTPVAGSSSYAVDRETINGGNPRKRPLELEEEEGEEGEIHEGFEDRSIAVGYKRRHISGNSSQISLDLSLEPPSPAPTPPPAPASGPGPIRKLTQIRTRTRMVSKLDRSKPTLEVAELEGEPLSSSLGENIEYQGPEKEKERDGERRPLDA